WGRRHPAPGSTHKNPAPIMKRRKSPRLVVDPRVAPGRHVGPMPVVIRRPTRFDTAREPYIAVIRRRAPSTLVVEILVADDIWRHIASGDRSLPARVTACTPGIEWIVGNVRLRILDQFISPGEHVVFVCINRVAISGTGDLALTIAHADRGRIPGFIDSKPVEAGAQH